MGKFVYAVARGRTVGIYDDWNQCKLQVNGFVSAKFKKFATREEAEQFIAEHSQNSSGLQGNLPKTLLPSSRKRHLTDSSSSAKKIKKDPPPNTPQVYTDGACSNNGALHAKAGWGVYWGEDHPDNICGPVDGAATNNRGELQAVVEALKQTKAKQLSSIIIHTDSKLLINSLDEWIEGWKRNGWKTKGGQLVKNRDLLEEIHNRRKDIEVCFKHVAGHSGDIGNDGADELARRGALMYK